APGADAGAAHRDLERAVGAIDTLGGSAAQRPQARRAQARKQLRLFAARQRDRRAEGRALGIALLCRDAAGVDAPAAGGLGGGATVRAMSKSKPAKSTSKSATKAAKPEKKAKPKLPKPTKKADAKAAKKADAKAAKKADAKAAKKADKKLVKKAAKVATSSA